MWGGCPEPWGRGPGGGEARGEPAPVVELGSRILTLPRPIRCWRASKKACGMWKTRGSGLPEGNTQTQEEPLATEGISETGAGKSQDSDRTETERATAKSGGLWDEGRGWGGGLR